MVLALEAAFTADWMVENCVPEAQVPTTAFVTPQLAEGKSASAANSTVRKTIFDISFSYELNIPG